ncbi:stage II sporulation protein D [Caldicellulosiruptor morganii]|nr:stage II sporulation protein D [Caldicellulosiruptor morganii]
MRRQLKKAFLIDTIFMAAAVLLLLIANIAMALKNTAAQDDSSAFGFQTSGKENTEKSFLINSENAEKAGVAKAEIYINLLRKDTKKVERMSLEEYVVGAVAAEMPAEFPIEALKAQAVACRTYAMRKVARKLLHSGYERQKVYLCDDFAHCQAYIDKNQMKQKWGKNFTKYYQKLCSAVMATKGEVLVYNGEIIDCLFHAASGGRTEDAREVFGQSIPYLKSVVSRGEEACPKFSGEFYFSCDEFVKRLKSFYPNLKLSAKDIASQVKVLQRTNTQRVKMVKVGNIKISGEKFRQIFGLYSTEFWIYPQQSRIEIRTRGYGHGLGMSQWGAGYLARQGKSYKEILFYYYKNVKIYRVKLKV